MSFTDTVLIKSLYWAFSILRLFMNCIGVRPISLLNFLMKYDSLMQAMSASVLIEMSADI